MGCCYHADGTRQKEKSGKRLNALANSYQVAVSATYEAHSKGKTHPNFCLVKFLVKVSLMVAVAAI